MLLLLLEVDDDDDDNLDDLEDRFLRLRLLLIWEDTETFSSISLSFNDLRSKGSGACCLVGAASIDRYIVSSLLIAYSNVNELVLSQIIIMII